MLSTMKIKRSNKITVTALFANDHVVCVRACPAIAARCGGRREDHHAAEASGGARVLQRGAVDGLFYIFYRDTHFSIE
jgi:hypothetical protein